MFDIKILGYSFYHEYNDKAYPVVEMEAVYEDEFLCMPIKFERVYDAYDWVYSILDGTLDDMIKNFVDELWKEFHKGIPKVYEISLYIFLPVGLNMWIKEHIRLVNKTLLVLGRGSGKLETQMRMLENYIPYFKKDNDITELGLDEMYIIIEMINKCNEKSQTECYETMNRIKNIFGGNDNE